MFKKAVLFLSVLFFSVAAYAGNTLVTLPAASSVGASDLFLVRPNGATSDKSVTGTVLSTFIQSILGTTPDYTVVSGRSYLAGPRDAAPTSTNTLTLTSDKNYGVLTPLPTGTITAIGFRTSSSSASVGASAKLCLYSLTGVDSSTLTLLGQTSAVTITDLATSTAFTGTLGTPVAVTANNSYVISAVYTTTTTAARASVYSSINPWINVYGASSIANALGSVPTVGFIADATYASGCPASFGTNKTAITAVAGSATNQLPVYGFTLQ